MSGAGRKFPRDFSEPIVITCKTHLKRLHTYWTIDRDTLTIGIVHVVGFGKSGVIRTDKGPMIFDQVIWCASHQEAKNTIERARS